MAPLPPYIADRRDYLPSDATDYQTIYAAPEGSVAAPTAGLHFTPELMATLEARGVQVVRVCLHVGAGTFLPVKAEETSEHVMHFEQFEISADAAKAINAAKSEGRRVTAVGTTSLRALESAALGDGRVAPGLRSTDIFITPGYRFKIVDRLMTNFHLPRSTLFMLVSAFSGLETMQRAYRHAIAGGYRFYSYGDASLLDRIQEK
jgi:S-adenosylmethionine:tRNA ribosyltransferase-isomerase